MRWWRRLAVVLVVLAGLLVVADRVAAWAAQQVVAEQVAAELDTYRVESAPPDVSIGGFPFLTQVAAGRYDAVTLHLRDVGTGSLRLPTVELTASDVTAPASTLIERSGPIQAARVDGTATVGYGTVTALTDLDGLELGPDGGGALSVRLPADLLGESVTLTGTATVEVDEQQVIRVRVQELTVEAPGEPPVDAGPLIEQYVQALSFEVPLPPLPYGLTVESVRAGPAGLAVGMSARDVPLSGVR